MTTYRFRKHSCRRALGPSALLAAAGAVWLAGCKPPLPPKELTSAREAYAAAKQGPPAELAPSQLVDGRQALDRAEESFKKEKTKPVTADLSYVALRQIQLAESAAALESARRDRVAAEREREELMAKLQELTEARLGRTEAELEKERQALAEKEREKAALAADASKTKAELEKERKAREAAEKKLSAALQSLEKIAQIKEEARGVVITLSGAVLFASGKHDLLPIAQSKLDEVAQAVKDQGYKKIVVEGHTDSVGSDQNNLQLSQRRAEAVRAHLVSRGIDAGKITAVGIGEARPVASNDNPEGRANNRRVELIVTPE